MRAESDIMAQRDEIEKKPVYKKAWFWILIVVLIIGVGGAIASSEKDPKKVGETATDTSTNNSTTNKQDVFKVGDVVAIEDQEVSVVNVTRDYQPTSDIFSPKDGKEYVKVDLKIHNTSSENGSYNALYWQIEPENGELIDYMNAAFAQADDSLSSGELTPGGTKTGSIVYEIPQGSATLKMHFKPNIISGREAVIELQ